MSRFSVTYVFFCRTVCCCRKMITFPAANQIRAFPVIHYLSIRKSLPYMDYAIAIAKRFVSFPFSSQRKRKMSKMTTPTELTQLGLDSMLSVLSYIDGESMYELGCANKSYDRVSSVTIDLSGACRTRTTGKTVLLTLDPCEPSTCLQHSVGTDTSSGVSASADLLPFVSASVCSR